MPSGYAKIGVETRHMGNAHRSWALLALAVCLQAAPTVRVENPAGAITVEVVTGREARMRATSPDRAVRSGDVELIREKGRTIIRVHPPDGIRLNLKLFLPYGYHLEARTTDGPIRVEGMIRRAELVTGSGDLHLKAPWEFTRLSVVCQRAPERFEKPATLKLRISGRARSQTETDEEWSLTDKLRDTDVTYGRIVARAERPGAVILEQMEVPADAPVKPPGLAWQIVNQILERRTLAMQRKRRRHGAAPKPAEQPAVVEGGVARFTGEVRMVTLMVAVYDKQGRPVTDLAPAEFEVLEDGVRQEIAHAGTGEEPFNLALLLDLSGSTRRDREAMMEAAKRFVGIARPQDKVAVYVLAASMFQVVSPLTENHKRVYDLIDAIPDVSGGSPIYDAIVLAYAQELRQRPLERNALIVITDGVDSRLRNDVDPSKVSIKKLRRAAESMNVLIYPIFLDPFRLVRPPRWAEEARRNLTALARTTGGRLFAAHSIRDLDPVYELVADELRSVYTLAYYPKNQNFDGSWRSIQVRVKRAGVKVRTRPGYYAE